MKIHHRFLEKFYLQIKVSYASMHRVRDYKELRGICDNRYIAKPAFIFLTL